MSITSFLKFTLTIGLALSCFFGTVVSNAQLDQRNSRSVCQAYSEDYAGYTFNNNSYEISPEQYQINDGNGINLYCYGAVYKGQNRRLVRFKYFTLEQIKTEYNKRERRKLHSGTSLEIAPIDIAIDTNIESFLSEELDISNGLELTPDNQEFLTISDNFEDVDDQSKFMDLFI